VSTLAYLDAATGSMVAAAAVAGFATVTMLFKHWWFRFTAIFSKSRRAELEATKLAVAEDADEGEEIYVEEPAETLSFDS
jgi:hypothetical protein